MALADRLASCWYGPLPPPWWCLPLEKLYGLVTRLRRLAWRRGYLRAKALAVPVIVVGNLSVGGTGKTPLTIALAKALRARGYRPGVVSRGYGGAASRSQLLGATPDPAQVGDEPCLIRASGIAVAVGRDRVAAGRLLQDMGCNLIVADDGLQHYRLGRDLEIAVVDGVRRFGNERLLPAGPLREPVRRWSSVDFRVCNGGLARAGEVPMHLEGTHALALLGNREQPLAALRGQRLHAVAGIGNPERFFASLREFGLDIIEHPFADHHAFVPADLAFADDAAVVMTAKDAVKCQAFARVNWWSVPVRAKLPASFLAGVVARIERIGSAGRAS